jgi:hypothetical protein
LPQIRWRTLGVPDRIRVPRPAAMMRTVKGSGMGLGGYRRTAGLYSGRRTRTSLCGTKTRRATSYPIPERDLSLRSYERELGDAT